MSRNVDQGFFCEYNNSEQMLKTKTYYCDYNTKDMKSWNEISNDEEYILTIFCNFLGGSKCFRRMNNSAILIEILLNEINGEDYWRQLLLKNVSVDRDKTTNDILLSSDNDAKTFKK